MPHYSEIFLMLFIVNLGIAFGAGIYETRIVLPLWFKKTTEGYAVDVKAMNEIETGRKFWGMVTTIPLTLLTLINLFIALNTAGVARNWWLMATIITLVERVGTFSFFIPTAIKLQKSENMPAAIASQKVSLWLSLNSIRTALNFIGMLLALYALSIN